MPNAKTVTTIEHDDAGRKNIPTAEYQSVLERSKLAPMEVRYPRQNTQWLSELAALHDAGKAVLHQPDKESFAWSDSIESRRSLRCSTGNRRFAACV